MQNTMLDIVLTKDNTVKLTISNFGINKEKTIGSLVTSDYDMDLDEVRELIGLLEEALEMAEE